SFPPLTATVVRALLLTGVAVRATGLRALGRTGSGWVQAWRHRAQWRDGYPAAVPGSLGARTGALP
ncbi:MAG TPA: hypothetical protein PKB06_10940, partial [Actinotalea sp.]|nr:hypothetical protein [Actinotalea sp.]